MPRAWQAAALFQVGGLSTHAPKEGAVYGEALDSVVAGIPTFGPVVSRLLRGISNPGDSLHILQTKFHGHQETERGSIIHSEGLTVEVCGEQSLRMTGRRQVD